MIKKLSISLLKKPVSEARKRQMRFEIAKFLLGEGGSKLDQLPYDWKSLQEQMIRNQEQGESYMSSNEEQMKTQAKQELKEEFKVEVEKELYNQEQELKNKQEFKDTKNFKLSKNILQFCSKIQPIKLTHRQKKNMHGQLLMKKIKDIPDFIRLWRMHFLQTMKPKYLPQNWKIDHGCYRSFGIHSKFYSKEASKLEQAQKQQKLNND